MSKGLELVMINGVEVSVSDIGEDLFSSALFYGTGCFETIRYNKDRILRFEEHMSRLHRGLNYLELPDHLLPENEVIYQKISQIIDNGGLKGEMAKIRVQCSLIEKYGYHVDPDVQLLTHIRVNRYEERSHDIKLLTAKTRVIPSESRPSNLKLSNMLHYRSAYREAVKQNYDEALMLTLDGHIAETSMANIFWAMGNRVYTPSKDCSILPGIMRGVTIELIKRSDNLTIEEGIFKPDSLLNADLVWLSNSVIELQPVLSIDNTRLKCNEILLKEIYSAIQGHNWSNSNR